MAAITRLTGRPARMWGLSATMARYNKFSEGENI